MPAHSSGATAASCSLWIADAQHVALMHNDLLGVTAERVAGRVLRRAVIGEHHTIAIVFQPVPALLALFTAVDHTADAHQIANGVAGDPLPTAVTRPTISWPGTQGIERPAHSERAWCTSEWQTPQ